MNFFNKNKAYIFLLLSFLLLTINLGSWGITETSEARYAEISKEMLDNHDFVHPKLLGIHHYHKPPITYQITAIGYKIFGINEFGARFFLQIAIIIQLLLVFQIASLIYQDKTIAFSAMLIYFSIPLVLISSRNLTTDAYLNTSVLASVYFWLVYKLKNRVIYMYLFYIVMAISFNIKGPVGWIFPLIFIINYKLILKDNIKINWHHVLGLLVFLVLSFSWYIKVFIENELLWNYFMEEQIVNRVASKSYNRAKPFWFYLVTLPGIGLPWILFLIHQNIKNFKNIKTKKSFDYVLLLTVATIFIVFSIFKTKLVLYILPMFGFVAILTAKLLSEAKQKTLSVYNTIILVIIGLLLIALIVLSVINSAYHFNMYYALVIAALETLALLLIIKNHISKNFLRTTYLGSTLGCVALVSGTFFMSKNQTKLNSTKEIIGYINSNLKDVDNILVYNYLLPSAQFYSDKNIITLNNGHNTVQRETQFETNGNWKDFNLNVQTEAGKNQAKKLLENHSVILTKTKYKTSKTLQALREHLEHEKDFGKWIIYY